MAAATLNSALNFSWILNRTLFRYVCLVVVDVMFVVFIHFGFYGMVRHGIRRNSFGIHFFRWHKMALSNWPFSRSVSWLLVFCRVLVVSPKARLSLPILLDLLLFIPTPSLLFQQLWRNIYVWMKAIGTDWVWLGIPWRPLLNKHFKVLPIRRP